MLLKIKLDMFYSKGDEERFFQGLKGIPSIKNVHGVGRELFIEIDLRSLSNDWLRELVALLWRYGISLAPLGELCVKNGRFAWLSDKKSYWYQSMFQSPNVRPEA